MNGTDLPFDVSASGFVFGARISVSAFRNFTGNLSTSSYNDSIYEIGPSGWYAEPLYQTLNPRGQQARKTLSDRLIRPHQCQARRTGVRY